MEFAPCIISVILVSLVGVNSLQAYNGIAVPSVEDQLQGLQTRLNLMYMENSEQVERLATELHFMKQSLDSLVWLSERVERSVQMVENGNALLLRNITLLNLQSDNIMTNQQYCANHDALRKQFFDLVPKCSGYLPGPAPNSTIKPPSNDTADRAYRSCNVAPDHSGVYNIALGNSNNTDFKVFCEQEKFGGRWMVIQNRQDGSVDFNRSWSEYREGFGNVGGEYWLGLENLYQLTSRNNYELLVVMENFTNFQAFQTYTNFKVLNENTGYKLTLENSGTGTAKDSLFVYRNEPFVTYDNGPNTSCSYSLASGFWHYRCTVYGAGKNNLNGMYGNHTTDPKGIWWGSYNSGRDVFEPLKRVQMMIRVLA